MSNQYCWEFKKCGRQPGGPRAAELGVCPAATEATTAEAGSGKSGCRACWAINGKFPGDVTQNAVTRNLGECLQCGFLKQNENTDGLYDIIVREVISLM